MSKEFLDVDSNRFIENVKYYIERYGFIENVFRPKWFSIWITC